MKALIFSVVLMLAGVAVASGMVLSSATPQTLANCSSGGSSAITVRPGRYWLATFDEEVFLCQSATCATGGIRTGIGERAVVFPSESQVSCRSTSSTGDLVLTKLRKPVSENW